jgi:hypothetical protein
MGTLGIQLRKSSLILPLNKECTLLLCPLRHFGLYWIHAFKIMLELLKAVFLGNFSCSFQPIDNDTLLPDDPLQVG